MYNRRVMVRALILCLYSAIVSAIWAHDAERHIADYYRIEL
jgi:hypothetical protein